MRLLFFGANMDFTAYIYEGKFNGKNSDTTSMVMSSLEKYAASHGIDFDRDKAVIKEGEHGKPYLEDSRMHFNMSHSGEMAVACVGEAPVGIDIQTMEVTTYKAIAKKYYTSNEQAYVDKYGMEGFYRVWVHREAYGKLTGEGFFQDMPEFIDDEGYPKIEVEPRGDYPAAFLRDIPIAPDVFCCFASFGEDDNLIFNI